MRGRVGVLVAAAVVAVAVVAVAVAVAVVVVVVVAVVRRTSALSSGVVVLGWAGTYSFLR